MRANWKRPILLQMANVSQPHGVAGPHQLLQMELMWLFAPGLNRPGLGKLGHFRDLGSLTIVYKGEFQLHLPKFSYLYD